MLFFFGSHYILISILNSFSGNDNHESIYDLNWIFNHSRSEIIPNTILWDGPLIEREIPQVASQDDNLNEEDLKILIKSLLQYGVGVVQQVR